MQDIIRSLSNLSKKSGGPLPMLRAGDTVRIMYRIVEGDRERLQPFQGVIMRLRGRGATQRGFAGVDRAHQRILRAAELEQHVLVRLELLAAGR